MQALFRLLDNAFKTHIPIGVRAPTGRAHADRLVQ